MTVFQYLQAGVGFFIIGAAMQLMPEVVFATSNASVTHRGNVELLKWMLG